MRRSATLSVLVLLAVLATAIPASAASRLVVTGRGWGHGIGLSQYGAKGYADHGSGYRDIVDHYYEGTRVLPLGSNPDVRVLLQSGRRAVVSGVVAAGSRKLSQRSTYSASASGGRIVLRNSRGKRLGTYDSPLRIAAPSSGSFRLAGMAANGLRSGRYRGALEVRASGSRVLAVNAVDLEDYIRGVVSAESPASWPAEALKAQAVVARSYAVTTNVGTTSDGIDQYADTRSQMYRGVAAEFPSTDAAVAATKGEVVAYQGRPVTTFFFSTSGGKTENIENSFVGSSPRAWLKGVDDPYDAISPKHKWGPITFSSGQVRSRLRGLVRGSFRGIKVLERGYSPRIVRASVLGSGGNVATTGPILRTRFGLNDTWASFTYITSSAKKVKSDDDVPAVGGDEDVPAAGDGTGGAAAAARASRSGRALTGRISGLRGRHYVTLERRVGGKWLSTGLVHVRSGGRYRAALPQSGTYRVAWGRIAGPAVRVR